MKANIVQKPVDETEKYGGLTEKEIQDAEMLIDPESAVKAMNINKKSHWRDVKKVIERSEVVVMVLDARDPEGTRAEEIETLITETGKKIVYVLNKTDLVPAENALAWISKFKSQKLLCLPFRANLSVLSKSDSEDV